MAKGRKKGTKTVWRKLEIDTSAPTAAAGDDCSDTSAPTVETGDDCCDTSAITAAAGDDCSDTSSPNVETGDDCCDTSAITAAAGDDCSDTTAPTVETGDDCCDNNKGTSTNATITCNKEMCHEVYDVPKQRRNHMAVRLEHYVVMFGGIDCSFQRLPCRVIWLYNLYTEMWTKHVISYKSPAPSTMCSACAVEINKDIYIFGGETGTLVYTNALWKLTKTRNRGFAWRETEASAMKCSERKPTPRSQHSAWAFDNKLWIFGGRKYVHQTMYMTVIEYDNQLFFFDTSCDEWTHSKCTGQTPPPGYSHATTVAGNKVWLYGGEYLSQYVHLHELDMQSLTWTIIDACFNKPPYGHLMGLTDCTLTAVTDNSLLLHAMGSKSSNHSLCNTWMLDLSSMSWRHCHSNPSAVPLEGYQSCAGINSDVIVLGGYSRCTGKTSLSVIHEEVVYHVKPLEPTSLQHLAMKIVYKHHNVLPWKQCLPTKLTEHLDIPEDDGCIQII